MNPGVRPPPPCPSGSCPSPPPPQRARPGILGPCPLSAASGAPPPSGGRTLEPAGLAPLSSAPVVPSPDSGTWFLPSDWGRATGRRPESGSWILGAAGAAHLCHSGSRTLDPEPCAPTIRKLIPGVWVLEHPPGLCWRPSLRTPDRGFWVGGRGSGKNSGLWILDLAARVISIDFF